MTLLCVLNLLGTTLIKNVRDLIKKKSLQASRLCIKKDFIFIENY